MEQENFMFKKFCFFLLLSFYVAQVKPAEGLPLEEEGSTERDALLQFKVVVGEWNLISEAMRVAEWPRSFMPIVICVLNTSSEPVNVGKIELREEEGEAFLLRGRGLLREIESEGLGLGMEFGDMISQLGTIFSGVNLILQWFDWAGSLVGLGCFGLHIFFARQTGRQKVREMFWKSKFPDKVVLQPDESIALLEFVDAGDVVRLENAARGSSLVFRNCVVPR
jgi:hypothetical protein